MVEYATEGRFRLGQVRPIQAAMVSTQKQYLGDEWYAKYFSLFIDHNTQRSDDATSRLIILSAKLRVWKVLKCGARKRQLTESEAGGG